MTRDKSRSGTKKPAARTTTGEDDAVVPPVTEEKETRRPDTYEDTFDTALANDEVNVDRDDDEGTSEDGERKEPEMMTLRVRITHAWSNVPSMEHLMETHEICVRADGADTVADVKRALSQRAKVPAHLLCLKWLDNPVGRVHLGQNVSVDEKETLAGHKITDWLRKFPHWCVTMCLLQDVPVDDYEAIHYAAAIHRGVKDPQAHVESIRGTPEWTELMR